MTGSSPTTASAVASLAWRSSCAVARAPASPSATPRAATTSSRSGVSSICTTSTSRMSSWAGCSSASAPTSPSTPRLRVLTLLEWQVRERLRKEGVTLRGIYAGQAGRKTDRPSAELLLRALKDISISVVELNGQTHALLSPLSEVQRRLLQLWDLPSDLYEKLLRGFPIPAPNTSEP